MFYLVKVRVDVTKMAEFGKKIANREFDNSSTKWTFSDPNNKDRQFLFGIKNDPEGKENFVVTFCS